MGSSNRSEWLEERKKGIGGSDAAAILGQNPYMSNVDLWEIKTGIKGQEDISEKECVKFGVAAEDHIRKLFTLDYPRYKVDNEEFVTVQNKDYPFIRGSFDGVLFDNITQQYGVLEIKTTTIRRFKDWEKWGGKNGNEMRIPQNYYCQILHYFLCRTDFKFAILKARIVEENYEAEKGNSFTEKKVITRHYHIVRADVEADLGLLLEAEKEFWGYVERNERPPLKLPNI